MPSRGALSVMKYSRTASRATYLNADGAPLNLACAPHAARTENVWQERIMASDASSASFGGAPGSTAWASTQHIASNARASLLMALPRHEGQGSSELRLA